MARKEIVKASVRKAREVVENDHRYEDWLVDLSKVLLEELHEQVEIQFKLATDSDGGRVMILSPGADMDNEVAVLREGAEAFEYNYVELSTLKVDYGNPEEATTVSEYMFMPEGSILAGDDMVPLTKYNDGWRSPLGQLYASPELAGVTREVLRKGWEK